MFTSLYLCVKSSGSRLCACCVYMRAHNDERVQAELYRANQIQPIEAGTGAPGADDI